MRSTILRTVINPTRSFSSSSSLNFARMTLLGRVGSDIVVREAAASGTPYISYSLAVQTGREKTSWFNVAVFNEKQIEFMSNYVKKG